MRPTWTVSVASRKGAASIGRESAGSMSSPSRWYQVDVALSDTRTCHEPPSVARRASAIMAP